MLSDARVNAIITLVKDTFDLWDLNRVGFSWRHYYLNHTTRIRNLSIELGKAEGGDPDALEVAAWLHDITKRYDGRILSDENGKRVVNEEGFWLNEMVQPDRGNWVTELYEKLNLWGQVHHESGATLTAEILREFGYTEEERAALAEIVRGHLKPTNLTAAELNRRYRLPETRVMYDADTIDPNLGYTAFYRNVQITMGRYLDGGELDLQRYVTVNIPQWVSMKEEFIGHMTSSAGKDCAAQRYRRLRALAQTLQGEAEHFEVNEKYGVIGCVKLLTKDAQDPSLHRHAHELREQWLPERARLLAQEQQLSAEAAAAALARARTFVDELDQEIGGLL